MGVGVVHPKGWKKKTGEFHDQKTLIWESGENTGSMLLSIGGQRPWAGEENMCQGDDWGCQNYAEMLVKIKGKEYAVPVFITGQGAKVFQLKLSNVAGEPTIAGYFQLRAEGQLLADIITNLR